VLRRSTTWLAERDVEGARFDAELLVAHALGLDRLQLYLQFDRPLGGEELARIRELVRRRGAHEPVAYLVGDREFYSLSFHVDGRVLVPRPETEHLVEVALAALRDEASPVFVDVGTGSGCVAVTLLHELPEARAFATDVSAGALEVARGNAERHGVADRLRLHHGDLLEPLRDTGSWGRIDAVVSNPPYVLPDDPLVEPGVRDHEPAEALFVTGDDPLEVSRRLARTAREALRPGGLLAIEVGVGSADDARAMLEELSFADVAVTLDLARIGRIVSGRTA
jgi:release factor glutamine methyltransferase